jgi:hypothetical protein
MKYGVTSQRRFGAVDGTGERAKFGDKLRIGGFWPAAVD